MTFIFLQKRRSDTIMSAKKETLLSTNYKEVSQIILERNITY